MNFEALAIFHCVDSFYIMRISVLCKNRDGDSNGHFPNGPYCCTTIPSVVKSLHANVIYTCHINDADTQR